MGEAKCRPSVKLRRVVQAAVALGFRRSTRLDNLNCAERRKWTIWGQISPLPKFTLTISAGMKAYFVDAQGHVPFGAMKSAREIISGNAYDDTELGQTIWIEGTSKTSGTLSFEWFREWTDFQGNKHRASAPDSVNLTTFTWTGPHNVPGTSTYTYAADGGAVGQDASKWVPADATSTLVDSFQNIANGTDEGDYKWALGPVIRHAAYQASPKYTWDMDVNVVRVDVLLQDKGEAFPQPSSNLPRDGGNNTKNGIYSKFVSGNNKTDRPD
jgi:hypothetical protein